jgi:hypothetical protein
MPTPEEYAAVEASACASCAYTQGSRKIEVTFFEPWNQMGISPGVYYRDSGLSVGYKILCSFHRETYKHISKF